MVPSSALRPATAFLCCLLVMSGSAFAHTGAGVAGGLIAGLLHPISGMDHLLAMVSVGIWGAFLGRPLLWQLPVAFPFMMVVGGALGIAGVPLPFVEEGIAASVLVLGLAIASAWQAPRLTALLIVAVFAVFHGHAHGAELPEAANAAAYAAGFVLATGALHLIGIAFGLLAKERAGRVVLQCAGGAIAVAGLWLLLTGLGVIGGPSDLPSST